MKSFELVMVGRWTSFGKHHSLFEAFKYAEDYFRSLELVMVGCWASFGDIFQN